MTLSITIAHCNAIKSEPAHLSLNGPVQQIRLAALVGAEERWCSNEIASSRAIDVCDSSHVHAAKEVAGQPWIREGRYLRTHGNSNGRGAETGSSPEQEGGAVLVTYHPLSWKQMFLLSGGGAQLQLQ